MAATDEGSGPQARAGPARLGLVGILILYCALATLQSLATRLQWGPDEPGHIIYVRSLALDGRLPALTHGEEENAYVPGAARTHESHQPPLYYALAALVWRAFCSRPDQTVTFRDPTGAEQSFRVPGPVRPVRLLSVVFGAAALLFAWGIARIAFPGRPELWLAATAITAFIPMFTYVTGVINNDPLLIAAFAAVGWQWARMLCQACPERSERGGGRRDAVVLGLLVGLAMNVKETAAALIPVSLLVIALEPAPFPWRRRLARMAGVVALAAAVSGWWYLRKWLIYGSPLVYPYIYPLLGLPEEQRAMLLSALPRTIFLFTFVPADVISAQANMALVTAFFQVLVVLSGAGIVLAFLRGKAGGMPRCQALSMALWLLTLVVVLVGLLRNVMTVDWRMGTSGGRYLACALPLLSLASARGLSALFGEGRWSQAGLAITCASLLAMNGYVVWATALEYGTLGR